MKIVFQHDHPLPVTTYGGTERIMFWHMKELVRQGHQVVLIGHPDSLVESFGLIHMRMKRREYNNWKHLVPKDADIIHLQYNHAVDLPIPTINTVHGNGMKGESFTQNSVFVSKSHAQNHGSDIYIHNALDFSEYPFSQNNTNSWNNFLFLAKASWKVKNLKGAVRACQMAKKHLHVAGGRYWWPSRFITSYGQVGGQEKLQIMNKCDALIFPVRWHEPFGLAIIEAWAMGLPVLGSCYGALSEIITPANGVAYKNLEELIDGVKVKPKFSGPQEIRKMAQKKFSIADYTLQYLTLYQQITNGKKLTQNHPRWRLHESAQDILPF
ncbi:MAG: glycosyltransferase [Bdellovibrionota bacterium]